MPPHRSAPFLAYNSVGPGIGWGQRKTPAGKVRGWFRPSPLAFPRRLVERALAGDLAHRHTASSQLRGSAGFSPDFAFKPNGTSAYQVVDMILTPQGDSVKALGQDLENYRWPKHRRHSVADGASSREHART